MTRSVIIYEACHAGSFVNDLSKEGRIIICSTDVTHNAYPNPKLTHTVFSEHFWAAVQMGYRLGYCFEYATECVDIWGLSDIQKHWIDDNHDGVGHEVNYWGDLPNGGDGSDALDVSLGQPILTVNWVNLMQCQLRQYVPVESEDITLWVTVENNTNIEYVRARIIPWWWEWPEPQVDTADGTIYFTGGQFFTDSFFDLRMNLEPGEKGELNYSTSINSMYHVELFGQYNGNYKILYEAKAVDGIVAKPITTSITMNNDGETPIDQTPPTVQITKPLSILNITGPIDIIVEADDDQALDKVQIFLDNLLIKEEMMPSYYPYPKVSYSFDMNKYMAGERNLTAIAIDKAGNKNQTSITINILNNNINIPSFNIPIIFTASFVSIILIITMYRKNQSKSKRK